ncbi:MAG: hypothetical protein V1768_02875 [Patescibacteria group bacterium]|nr:hypothetical protein [Patescibacteria group bacterium]MBU1349706.1 hypothetical protein [Patescibacteria group bacterium]MBU1421411.1 hypothetical protein [Patescibacteria group bacterium]
MTDRTKLILNTIIKEHIKTGAPVGSSVLVEKYQLDVSPATVRNEMAELESEGYIAQPYTSAGRVPTEQAFNLYIENLSEKKLNKAEINLLDNISQGSDDLNLKQIAKTMAGISNNAVFWAFEKHNLYYTGISNLLRQPEFSQTNLIYDISAIIDRVDEIIGEIFDEIKYEPQILLGSKNPFGDFLGIVLTKYKIKNKIGMFGILGPMRMDYEKNLAVMQYIQDKIL